MADATDVSLAPLQAAIVSRLQAQFPMFATVAFSPAGGTNGATTPAVLCELLRAEPLPAQTDAGSGQFACSLRILSRIVLDEDTDAALRLRDAALALATHLHQWGYVPGFSCERIGVLVIEPEPIEDIPAGRVIWRVEWSVPVLLGQAAWAEAGAGPPVQGFYSVAPEVGAAHVDAYRPLQAQP